MNVLTVILLIILALVFFLTLVFLFSKARVTIIFTKKNGEKSKTGLSVAVCGVLIKKDITRFLNKKKKPSGKKDKQTTDDKDETTFFSKAKNYYNTFLDFKKAYNKNSKKVHKGVHAEKIKISINFGTGDAAQTGILTGTIWAGVYNVIAFVSKIITVSQPFVDVIPAYNEQKCELKGECIITCRLANLIGIVVSIGMSYLKISKERKNIKKAAIKYGNTN